MDMAYLILILLLVVIAALAVIYRKIKRIDLYAWDLDRRTKLLLENEFRQIEALCALYVDLKLEHSLPQTRQWAGSPDFLSLLVKTILNEKPTTIVECSSGVSTIVAARAVEINGNGHIYSLEHEPEFANKTREELARQNLQRWATVIDAPLKTIDTKYDKQLWYDASSLPDLPIDILVVDGPPESTNPMARYPAGTMLLHKLTINGRAFLDDADRPDERAMIKEWLSEFPSLDVTWVSSDKGLAVISHRSCK